MYTANILKDIQLTIILLNCVALIINLSLLHLVFFNDKSFG